MAEITIVIILILGWIIYEQSSAKKSRTEREQKFENIESERKEKYKENPKYLKNVLKMNSTFELLTSTEIENLEIDYTSGEDYQAHQLKKSMFLNYYGTPFSLSLLASQIECNCFITTKSNKDIFIDLKLNVDEQNDKTVDYILKELKRVSGN